MKKAFKIIGWTLLTLVGLLVIGYLAARFVFRERIGIALARQERVEQLRSAGAYASDTTDYRFTYEQSLDRAREIREYFRLDTLLVPESTTWERTLALAKFVAVNIPHANQTEQPKTRNATALWEYHLTVEPAFNCRLHSILLHELLLAADITNRFVTCLPADAADADCHVVNLVWLPERKKWAMIDSDIQAWVASPDGTPLSLAEMRERIIADEPMEMRPLLDPPLVTDAEYLTYWAKNLYWFECWEQTGYDKEVHFEGRTIVLLPTGFEGFRLKDQAVCTCDDCRFWAAPETDRL